MVKRKYEEQVVQCYQIVQVIMTIIFFPDVGCKINTLKKLQNEQNVEGGEISQRQNVSSTVGNKLLVESKLNPSWHT